MVSADISIQGEEQHDLGPVLPAYGTGVTGSTNGSGRWGARAPVSALPPASCETSRW